MVTIQWKDTCIGWLLSIYALHICPIALQRPCIQWSKCNLESHSENGPPPLKYVMLGSYWLAPSDRKKKKGCTIWILSSTAIYFQLFLHRFSPTRHAGGHMNSNCTQSNHHNKIHSGRMKKHGLESWSKHGRRMKKISTCNPLQPYKMEVFMRKSTVKMEIAPSRFQH